MALARENASTLVHVASLESLLKKGRHLFKAEGKQIAVFAGDGGVFACNNRCPHEGYPLMEGSFTQGGGESGACILTCNWHNWKFRLQDGRCVLGGDHVRTYPAEVRDGFVWVNVEDPPPDVIEASVLDGLRTAFDKRGYGRICREITRLYYHRLDPLIAVRKAIEWSHDRLEFGTSHAYAAGADWLLLAQRHESEWEERLVCLAEAVDHMAFDALRHRVYPYAAPGEPFDPVTFVAAVEAEDRERAEGMVRRGLADGMHWPDMQEPFAAAALDHYNDFGHSLIFVQKTSQLLELAGPSAEPYLLPALTRSLCYTTREDLLPEFKEYQGALENLPEVVAGNGAPLDAAALFPVTIRRAIAFVREATTSHGPEAIYDALLELNARNMLHFDTSYQFASDRPVSENIGWLDFTHGITFANAVRTICAQYPRLWGAGLLQMALFAGRNHRFLDLELDESAWQVADADAFLAEAETRLLDHGVREPIFSAHLLKTTRAVREEITVASPSCRKYLLASLNRFLNAPLKQKHARRAAHQAIALVKRDFA